MPRDLTAVPVAHPAQFRQKNTAVFLIELNALRVAECIILSPLFESYDYTLVEDNNDWYLRSQEVTARR